MKNYNMRNETRIGLFLMAIYGLLNTVFSAPELLKGSVIGISSPLFV